MALVVYNGPEASSGAGIGNGQSKPRFVGLVNLLLCCACLQLLMKWCVRLIKALHGEIGDHL